MVTEASFPWPIGWLLVVLGVAAIATIVPWLIPRDQRKLHLSFIGAVIASCVWVLYEYHLNSLARPGDPLIRVDLFLIIPLTALDWLSASVSAIHHQLRERQGKVVPKEHA